MYKCIVFCEILSIYCQSSSSKREIAQKDAFACSLSSVRHRMIRLGKFTLSNLNINIINQVIRNWNTIFIFLLLNNNLICIRAMQRTCFNFVYYSRPFFNRTAKAEFDVIIRQLHTLELPISISIGQFLKSQKGAIQIAFCMMLNKIIDCRK